MQDAVVKKIKSKIAHGKFGEVYFVSSFPQYDVEYVTKLLAIFEREGLISRIAKGDEFDNVLVFLPMKKH